MLVSNTTEQQLRGSNMLAISGEVGGVNQTYNPLQPISDALGRVFTTQEETQTKKARRIMGTLVSDLSDEDLDVYITELQYLIDEWFDNFEREALDGHTLKQLLGQD